MPFLVATAPATPQLTSHDPAGQLVTVQLLFGQDTSQFPLLQLTLQLVAVEHSTSQIWPLAQAVVHAELGWLCMSHSSVDKH